MGCQPISLGSLPFSSPLLSPSFPPSISHKRSPGGATTGYSSSHLITAYTTHLLLICRPHEDERLSWPSWPSASKVTTFLRRYRNMNIIIIIIIIS